MKDESTLRIGELAVATDLTAQAIRFYEREGLLPRPDRGPNGYRKYGTEAADTLLFIRESQTAGFTLREIRALLRMDESGPKACSEMRDELGRKIESVTRQMAALKRVRARLVELRKHCDSAPGPACPALETLRGSGGGADR